MQIYQIARKYGLSRKTIHFYIQNDLLHPTKRENNYYEFDDESEKELKLILRLRQSGMSIENIQNMIHFPTCTNFFLFKQYFSVKKTQCKATIEQTNIQMLLEEIPPNGTYADIMDISDAYIKKDSSSFTESDAKMTARMTAIFLLTPFMHQEVDEYRKFLWQRIERITLTELKPILYDIMLQLTSLSAQDMYRLSTSLASSFDMVASGDKEKIKKYMKEQIQLLCDDLTVQHIWNTSYVKFITPVKQVYKECHKTLIRQYTTSYMYCMDMLKQAIDEIKNEMKEQTYLRILQATNHQFNILEEYYNDFFILFCFKNSVFLSPSVYQEKQH